MPKVTQLVSLKDVYNTDHVPRDLVVLCKGITSSKLENGDGCISLESSVEFSSQDLKDRHSKVGGRVGIRIYGSRDPMAGEPGGILQHQI